LVLRELDVSQVELDALWTFVKKKRLRLRVSRPRYPDPL
jgi:hypothetical protein